VEDVVSIPDKLAAFNGSGVVVVVPFVLGGKLVVNPGEEDDAERPPAPGVNDR